MLLKLENSKTQLSIDVDSDLCTAPFNRLISVVAAFEREQIKEIKKIFLFYREIQQHRPLTVYYLETTL